MIQAEPIPAEEVARALEEVFSGPDFEEAEPTLLDRFFNWIDHVLEGLSLPPGLSEGIGWGVLWAIGIVTAWLVAYALWKLAGVRRHRTEQGEQAQRSVRERVGELRERAERARGEGNLVLALRLYFFALVVGLGRKGDLEYRDAWTNRELLARGRPSPEVLGELGPLVAELDHKMFGDGETTEGDLDRMSALLDRWLDDEAARAEPAGAGGGA